VLDPITDITVNEGDAVTLNPSAIDPDWDALAFTYTGWMTSDSYVTVSGDAGTHTVTVTVSDGILTDSQVVTITVIAEDSSVVMLSPQDTFININSNVNANSQTLNTYTWPDYKPANAILMKYDLSGIPIGAIIQDATLYLSLVASDSTSDSTYTVSVHKIINKNPDISLATGYTYDGTNSWSENTSGYNNVPLAQADLSTAYDTKDIDKTLGYKSWNITSMAQEWINNPSTNSGLLLNSDSTKLRDRYRYFASMEDPNVNMRPYLVITLIGSGTNLAPVLDPITDITVNEGDTITLSPTATDPNGDTLTFTYSGWMSSSSYTSNYMDVGTHTVTVTVSDGILTDSQDVTITVVGVDAPVLDPIADITVSEGDTITLNPTATDPNGYILTYTYTGWMTSNIYTTSSSDVGTHTVTVTVSNGILTDSQDVTITVVNTGVSQVISWNANTEPDLAGYKVHYGISSGNYDTNADIGNETSYALSNLASGVTYYIAVTAYDSSGNESVYSDELIYNVPAF
jgi:hypothetical protein